MLKSINKLVFAMFLTATLFTPCFVAASQHEEPNTNLENLMPPIQHEPSVYVGDGKVFAFGVNIITPDGVVFAKEGIEISINSAGNSNSGETTHQELTEDLINTTMNSSYQGPSIVVRNGHVFAFNVKVTAQNGSFVYAGKGSEIAALAGSTVKAKMNSVVYANKFSKVFAEAGSRVQALQDSEVTASWGAYVVGEFESTVIAENGSTVRARYGALVKAGSGSTIYSEPGSMVEAENGAHVITSDVTPFDENMIK